MWWGVIFFEITANMGDSICSSIASNPNWFPEPILDDDDESGCSFSLKNEGKSTDISSTGSAEDVNESTIAHVADYLRQEASVLSLRSPSPARQPTILPVDDPSHSRDGWYLPV
jgi:hypothetical protein